MENQPKKGDLRVWHIPQVPMKPFYVQVESLPEAKKTVAVLCDYDLFQFHNHVKPDYANASGLEVFVENEGWCEWIEDESGDSIMDVLRRETNT